VEIPSDIDGEPVLDLPSVAEFDAWLGAWSPATGPRGVWLRIARKGAGLTSITADETVDVGLCHGWISAVRRRCDDQTYWQRYTPRRKGSQWSRLNISKVTQLTAVGRMRPSGQAEVDAAKADGRWDHPWT
jgi:uncharacterized protein YdeI (YjbR/CyaY-like superfamily)